MNPAQVVANNRHYGESDRADCRLVQIETCTASGNLAGVDLNKVIIPTAGRTPDPDLG